MLQSAASRELFFFDPDNGLEVPSCPPGRRGSEKYLLWQELTDSYQAGHSVLVYQHFARERRDTYIDRMSQRLADATAAREILAFQTHHVVFFLAPQHAMTEFYADRMRVVSARWKDVIAPVLIAVA